MTSKDFYSKKNTLTTEHRKASGSVRAKLEADTQQLMVEFARIKVHEVLEKVKTLQKLKFAAGETGYIVKSEFEERFPLSEIK